MVLWKKFLTETQDIFLRMYFIKDSNLTIKLHTILTTNEKITERHIMKDIISYKDIFYSPKDTSY